MNLLLCATLFALAGVGTRQASTTTGIVKVSESPVQVDEGKILRVVSGKSAFTVAGPKGAIYRFQPKVAAEAHWVSASIQVNGVEVATGQFRDGMAPVLGYSPTAAEEVAIYRVSAGDQSQNLAVYRLKTESKGLHHLALKVVNGSLVPAAKSQDSFLLFGSHGLIGKAQGAAFSIDLDDFPTGLVQFESVYVDGDYAEAPEVSQDSLEPRLTIQGVEQPLSTSGPVTIHLVDLHKKGIVGARITLNGRPVGQFSHIEFGVTMDLTGFNPGSYRMEVFGLLANGAALGSESREVELVDRGHGQSNSDPSPTTLSDFVLKSAYFGADAAQYVNVTARVAQILSRSTVIPASTGNFGDPTPGFHKQLVVRYTLKGKPGTLTCQEGESMDIASVLPPAPPVQVAGAVTGFIQILSADYSGKDVTRQIRDVVAKGEIVVNVNTAEFGVDDPKPGSWKTLTVKLIDLHGVRRTVTGREGRSLWLSDEPPTLFDSLSNGSFDAQETPGMVSEMKYEPADNGVLEKEGVYTVAYGLMRPFQLKNDFRLDFVERTLRPNSMAMFIHPKSGRQPMLLWAEKVKVQPNTRYSFECYSADLSENAPSAFASITLQADQISNNPVVFFRVDEWSRVHMTFTSGSKPYVTLKIWRDVLPEFADEGSLIGIDDITLTSLAGS